MNGESLIIGEVLFTQKLASREQSMYKGPLDSRKLPRKPLALNEPLVTATTALEDMSPQGTGSINPTPHFCIFTSGIKYFWVI